MHIASLALQAAPMEPRLSESLIYKQEALRAKQNVMAIILCCIPEISTSKNQQSQNKLIGFVGFN